ncbi:unnamed protein product (macronuclear) [Paramecium tetraurelia]|uniref:PAS domain-containing protein n=1 Tax=Paramecium tetraurelia TaxID=5888 RepID=A0BE28_PARTE|nr:uncharacterized protein GSPATT00027827001 [Paramecium tetraurelia]CAK56795.1 unnamed protein product [Paramecium tetraurelia]|eukprot:XP_001424193.1 hypothetical protein (macronuclear) [Paramecium tetraurelia strain d4-2]
MKRFLIKIKAFYIKDFLYIKESRRTTYKLAVVLIVFENLQMLSIYTHNLNTIQYEQFPNEVKSMMNYFKQIKQSLYKGIHFICKLYYFQNYKCDYWIFNKIVIDGQNSFFSITSQLFLIYHQHKQQKQIYQKKSHYHFEECWLSTLLSWYFQINLEVLQIPLLFCAVSLITDLISLSTSYFYIDNLTGFEDFGLLLSFILIIQQLLLGTLLHVHQFEYRIKHYDFLGLKKSVNNEILYLLKLFMIFLSGSISNAVLIQTLGLIINSIQTLFSYKQLTYIDHRVLNISFQINSLILLYQLALILCQFGQYQIKISLSLLILLFYPLAIFLLHQLSIRQEQRNDFKDQQDFLKRMYWNAKLQVQFKKRQQHQDQQRLFQIYTIVRTHLQTCKQIRMRKILKKTNYTQKCFCSSFQNQNSIQNIEQCKEFLKLWLGQVIEDELKEDGAIQKTSTYICYLNDIKKAPISAIYEVIRISNVEKLPWRFQQIIHQLQQNSLQRFNKLIQKQNLVNQIFDFKKACLFEESLKVLKLNFFLIVKQEIEFYQVLFSPIINAKDIQDKGLALLANINHLENQIQYIFRTNPQNGECDTIYKLFQKYINYNKKRKQQYRRDGQLTAEFIQSVDKIIYDQHSCVVQITLLQPRGDVIRYTRSFQQLIQFKDDEILNQNIKKFIPSIIANGHDQYLNNFVETGRINVLKRELRIILVKQKSEFVIPINTRLRIEVNPLEFGAQALMTSVNQTYGYLMLNEQGQVEEITKNIYEDTFQQYLGLDLDTVKGLDFLLLIPELSKIWQNLFDENFDKLDLYQEGELVIPIIEKQTHSQIFSQKYGNKQQYNKRLGDYMKKFPENAIKTQINFHLTSLTTINLRVVIVEIPEYRQTINKQYQNSLKLIQVKPSKSQNNVIYQSELLSHKSPLYTPAPSKTLMNECDLEYDYLIEEKRMIEEFRNQLASLTRNNSIQNTYLKAPIIQEQQCQISTDIKIIMPQNITSRKGDEFEQKQHQQQHFLKSIDTKSSQNNNNTIKQQIKSCLKNNKKLNFRIKSFLLIFYSLLLTGFILNFCILLINFEKVDKNVNFEDLPYQLSYYYNEFVISKVYQSQNEFNFKSLLQVSINYYQQHQKYIDEILSLMPSINIINEQTVKRRTTNLLQQMSEAYHSNSSITGDDFFNNTQAFHILLDKFAGFNSLLQIQSLLNLFIFEEVIIFLLLICFAYFYISILKMKASFYKLFCTFSRDFMKDQFIQFQALHNQINQSKFKTSETNEESFEASMISQYQKNSRYGNLENHVRIGKQIQTPQISLKLYIFTFTIFIFFSFYSLYYFGTYFMYKQVLSSIELYDSKRIYYENIANDLIFAYAQQAFYYNKTITQEMIQYEDKVLGEFKQRISQISQFQDQSNLLINRILLDEVCIVYQEGMQSINMYLVFYWILIIRIYLPLNSVNLYLHYQKVQFLWFKSYFKTTMALQRILIPNIKMKLLHFPIYSQLIHKQRGYIHNLVFKLLQKFQEKMLNISYPQQFIQIYQLLLQQLFLLL